MNTPFFLPRCAAGALLFSLARLGADTLPLTPILQSATGLAGTQTKLTWSPQSNVRYRVEKSTTLSPSGPGGWSVRALVEGGEWLDPELPGPRAFYRVPAPVAEVFSVEPPVLGPTGGDVYLSGQCIPAGSSLVLEREGLPPVVVTLVPQDGGIWRATVVGGLVPGGAILSARVVDANGVTVCTIGQTFEVTADGRATDAPPTEPPSSPLGMAINEKGLPGEKPTTKIVTNSPKRTVGGGDDCDDLDPGSEPFESLLMPALMKAKEKANRTKCGARLRDWQLMQGQDSSKGSGGGAGKASFSDISMMTQLHGRKQDNEKRPPYYMVGLPGEVTADQEVLELETPAGPDIGLSLHYRSRAGTGGLASSAQQLIACGSGWACSYDLRIVPVPLAAGASAPRLYLYGGEGRRDVLVRQADGSYRGDGMFREGRFDPDTTFRLTFADQSQFIFCRLVGAPWTGRIGSIADANGVAINFTYNGAAQLVSIASQFGQSLTLGYGAGGLLSTVTDHTGRAVSLTYYDTNSEGPGSPGDLKTVSCPQVPGQLPPAGPVTFTYSTGSTDARLNHNLLSATDGAGRVIGAWTYSQVTNAASIAFDTCASESRNGSLTLSGHKVMMNFEIPPPVPSSPVAYRGIVNDQAGRVCECDFDAQHREVACREYTGFATPDVVTTSTANRPAPGSKLRAGDPDFYQTQCRYNPDHRIKNRTLADGTQERRIHDRELRPDCPVRERGNVRVFTLRAPNGEKRTLTWDFLPGFGTSESDLKASDGKKHFEVTAKWQPQNLKYLAGGGKAQGVMGQKAKAWMVSNYEVNPVFGLKTEWITSIGLPKVTPKIAKESHGKFRQMPGGGGSVWDGGDGDGGCTDYAVAGNPISGLSIKGGRNPGGNPTRLITAHGQVFTWSYDTHGNCTASRTPIAGAGGDATFNSLGQCTGATILNGPGSSFHTQYLYHPVTSWTAGCVEDPDLNGDGGGLSLTTQVECDALGRSIRIVDPRGFDWLTEYDGLDHVTVTRTPVVGTAPTASRITTTFTHDAAGLLARWDVEHRDSSGAPVAANPAYTGFVIRESPTWPTRPTRIALEQRPVDVPAGVLSPDLLGLVNFAITDCSYDDAGQCDRVSTPAISRGQTTDAVCDYRWDERGLLYRSVQGGTATPTPCTIQWSYDAFAACVSVSQLQLCPLPPPPPCDPIETLITYDGFHRLSSITDPMGNVTSCTYDEQGFVTVAVSGEVNDVPGSAGNVPMAQARVRKGMQDIHNSRIASGPGDACDFAGSRAINTNGHGVRFSAAFFDVFVTDDLCTVERFAPGAPAPHATETTTVHRSPAGLMMNATTNGDTLLTCTYDTAGRSATSTDGFTVNGTVRDKLGNVILDTRTDLPGVVGAPSKIYSRASVFDELGRCTSSTDGGGNSESCQFDSLGRCTRHTDARGTVHRISYDVMVAGGGGFAKAYTSRVEVDTEGAGTFVLRSADEGFFDITAGVHRTVCVTNSNGYATMFQYDSRNCCVLTTYPDGTHESVGFDGYGRTNHIIHRDLATRNLLLDANGRVLQDTLISPLPGTIPVAPVVYAYNGLGQCVQCDQGDSHLVFTCDSLGHQLSEHHNGYGVTRTFDHRGRTGITYSDGTRFSEQRNAIGLLVSVSAVNSAGAILSPPVSSREYLGHRVASETRRNGVVSTFTFRGDGDPAISGLTDFSFDCTVRCVRTSGTTVLSDEVTSRDPNQGITRTDTFFTGSNVASRPFRRKLFTLDRLGRITHCITRYRATAGGQVLTESDVTYSLDLEGRRLSASGGANPGTYTQSALLPPGDHQMSQYTSWPRGPLEWDDAGCLTIFSSTNGMKQLVYDAASRLVAVNDANTGAPLATYAYDATGRRTRSTLASSDPTQPPVSTYFVYDGDTCVQELGSDGLPNLTMAATGGIHHCIISRNGSLVYPHGASSDAKVTPTAIEDKYEFTVTATFERMGRPAINTAFYSDSAGAVTERTDCDDAGKPIFLTSEGIVRQAATGTLSGYDWFGSGDILIDMKDQSLKNTLGTFTLIGCGLRRYCPETGFFQGDGSVYSPQLGQTLSVTCTNSVGTSAAVSGGR